MRKVKFFQSEDFLKMEEAIKNAVKTADPASSEGRLLKEFQDTIAKGRDISNVVHVRDALDRMEAFYGNDNIDSKNSMLSKTYPPREGMAPEIHLGSEMKVLFNVAKMRGESVKKYQGGMSYLGMDRKSLEIEIFKQLDNHEVSGASLHLFGGWEENPEQQLFEELKNQLAPDRPKKSEEKLNAALQGLDEFYGKLDEADRPGLAKAVKRLQGMVQAGPEKDKPKNSRAKPKKDNVFKRMRNVLKNKLKKMIRAFGEIFNESMNKEIKELKELVERLEDDKKISDKKLMEAIQKVADNAKMPDKISGELQKFLENANKEKKKRPNSKAQKGKETKNNKKDDKVLSELRKELAEMKREIAELKKGKGPKGKRTAKKTTEKGNGNIEQKGFVNTNLNKNQDKIKMSWGQKNSEKPKKPKTLKKPRVEQKNTQLEKPVEKQVPTKPSLADKFRLASSNFPWPPAADNRPELTPGQLGMLNYRSQNIE